jgi:N-acetylmuramoyl-L-alanine amidase
MFKIQALMKPLLLSIFLLNGALFSFDTYAETTIQRVQISNPDSGAQAMIKLTKAAKVSHFTLKNPNRVVVDIRDAKGTADYQAKSADDLIQRVRNSKPKTSNDTRFVFEVAELLDYEVTTVTHKDGPYLLLKFDDPQPQSLTMITGRQSQRDDDIIIALDAGHGGRDPGSIGPKGTYEKHITLAIAKKLQKRINAEKGMRAVLTREGDYYISPSQRPLMAREKKADLLISIHADAFHTPQPRGASVWTINERRSNTEFARLLENKSRQSELLSGASTVIAQSDDDLGFVRTILDMTKEGARKSSYEASDYIIKELKKVTKMHKKDRQYASLAVLTAQDIPSILVEVGFISNPTEEKNLNWSKYRQRLADAIFIGLEKYFKIYPPNGTLWSRLEQKTDIQHVVKSGESLFKIARRYDTSIEHIKRVNNLTENSLTVNQKLVIPRG